MCEGVRPKTPASDRTGAGVVTKDDTMLDPGYPLQDLCALWAHRVTPEYVRAQIMINRVLVVDGDTEARRDLQLLLAQEGCETAAVQAGRAVWRELKSQHYDGVFCTVGAVGDILARLARDEEAPLVIVTASREERQQGLAAVAEGGAFDFLSLPAEPMDVALTLRRAVRFEEMRRRQPARGRKRTSRTSSTGKGAARTSMAGMVGMSASMQEVFDTIEKVAQHKAGVLIVGESGTGKELVARAVHDLSPRKSRRFVAINCGAIPANLLESELFGHRRGAFTDAVRDKPGLFEAADGGTLFLDEIGEMPLNLQVKLLRVLQEEEIRRIGDNVPSKVDVRIIAATLRNLGEDVANGRFREDLYYRLNVLPIMLPPLRQRRDDIRPLVEHFLAVYRDKHGGGGAQVEGVSKEAMALLESYEWPGNIRELENTIERAMVLADSNFIEARLLDDKLKQRRKPSGVELPVDNLSIKKNTRRIEEELIRRALVATEGNRTNASKLLEISHRALLYKIKEYGI